MIASRDNNNTIQNTEPESVATHSPASVMESSQTIEFRDQGAAWTQSTLSAPDSTYNVGYSSMADLGGFLSRPIQLTQFTWTNSTATKAFPGADKAYILDPWSTFLNEPEIKKKISSFRFLRSSLKVKFLVNGNGFLFGQMAVFYHPLYNYDDFKDYGTPTSWNSTTMQLVRVNAKNFTRHSQKPHLFLVSSLSQGGTMELPFVWFRNFIDITSQDPKEMGRLLFYPLNDLTVNDSQTKASAKCDVTVMAWMENPILSTPTSQDVPANYGDEEEIPVSQSGKDEYGSSPVSNTANAISASMSSLAKVPYIGPYARASSMVAGAIGTMARMFGFSRPTIVSDISPYKPVYLGNMANTDAGDTSYKLTFDSKQEVTIDPRVVGLSSTDEMTITHIASKESFLITAPWESSYTTAQRILTVAVTPQLFRYDSAPVDGGTPLSSIQLTACAYAAHPFLAWRGTMRYRFQIIASQFHRGKIRVVWDPIAINGGTGTSTNKFEHYNRVYSKIIDLAECRDFTVDIGWGQATSYLPLTLVYGDTLQETAVAKESGTGELPSNPGFNGVMGIFVVNPLITAGDNYIASNNASPIYVNCFVSCPDLVVANPSEENLQIFSFFNSGRLVIPSDDDEDEIAVSQSGFIEQSEGTENAPTATNTVHFELGPPIQSLSDGSSNVYYGDPILSIRNLIKRYVFYCKWPQYPSTLANAKNPVASRTRYYIPDYPLYQGEVTGRPYPFVVTMQGKATTDPGERTMVRYNPVMTSFMNFYTPAFVCRRGGIRWKYSANFLPMATPVSPASTPYVYNALPNSSLRVARCPHAKDLKCVIQDTASSKPTDVMAGIYMSMPSGAGGQFVTKTAVQPTVEVELPFYNYTRFVPGFSLDVYGEKTNTFNRGEDENDFQFHQVVFEGARVDNAAGSGIDAYCAAADDYSLFFYLCPPVMFNIAKLKAKCTVMPSDSLFVVPDPGTQ